MEQSSAFIAGSCSDLGSRRLDAFTPSRNGRPASGRGPICRSGNDLFRQRETRREVTASTKWHPPMAPTISDGTRLARRGTPRRSSHCRRPRSGCRELPVQAVEHWTCALIKRIRAFETFSGPGQAPISKLPPVQRFRGNSLPDGRLCSTSNSPLYVVIYH